ncbi:hypothetical protein GCM10025871_34420 [Deinococcus metallilatus]|nr:hypothetical protein GCM10025871_34420 [Deinococcus metallilatus]
MLRVTVLPEGSRTSLGAEMRPLTTRHPAGTSVRLGMGADVLVDVLVVVRVMVMLWAEAGVASRAASSSAANRFMTSR